MLRIALAGLAVFTLTACVYVPNHTPNMARIDGRSVVSSPALEQQARQDITVCKGELSKAMLTAPGIYPTQTMTNVYVGCMAARGYALTDQPASLTH